jgi:putative DNA primase/helicase
MSKVQGRDALEARARKIVEALGGAWSRSKGMCCCPAHADRTPSLSITLGSRAILVHCFAGCSNQAVMQGMARLGVRISDLFDGAGGVVTSEPREELADRNALRLWREASTLSGRPPSVSCGAPDQDIVARPALPSAHTARPQGRGAVLAGLVAAVRNDAGILALHRTFLDPKTTAWPVRPTQARAGQSRFRRSAPWPCPRGGGSGLAEGIESALSAMQLFGIPCWATLGQRALRPG